VEKKNSFQNIVVEGILFMAQEFARFYDTMAHMTRAYVMHRTGDFLLANCSLHVFARNW